MSTTDILMNSAALNSLKRNQLVSLCKSHGLKANGKNTELIGRLQDFARENPTREAAALPNLKERFGSSQVDEESEDVDMEDEEERKEAERAKMRPSEVWEVIEEETAEEMRKLQEESLNKKGSMQSNSSKISQMKLPGEFGTSTATTSKGTGSSVTSSLKSLATTFKWGSTKSHNSVKPPQVIPAEPEVEPEQMDMDTTSLDTSIELDRTTVRLVNFNSAPSYPSPPPLRPFRPSLPLAPLLPASPDSKPSLFPPIPKELVYTPVRPSPLSFDTSNSPSASASGLKKPEPFIFGSPAPRNSVSNAEFNNAASSVLEEMNKRLGVTGAAPISSSILSGRTLGKAQETLDEIDRQKQEMEEAKASRPIKTPKRFSDAHKKEFEKMESIVDYAARRDAQRNNALGPIERKRKSNVLEGDGAGPSMKRPAPFSPRRGGGGGMPGGFGGDDDDEPEPQLPQRDTKRVRVSEAPAGDNVNEAPKVKIADNGEPPKHSQSDKEKEAIKRKLEASRARRRSSRGRPSVGGRQSVGKVAPPQARKGITSRFGFLKGAVGAVKNVWNRGAGAPAASSTTTTTVKTITSTSTKKTAMASSGPTRPSSLAANAEPRKVSAGMNRGLIPNFGSSKSRASTASSANGGSTKNGSTTNKTGGSSKSKIAQINSVGFKRSSHLDSAGIENGSVRGSLTSGSTKRERTSFMAPTQSSLARMNSARASNASAAPVATEMPGIGQATPTKPTQIPVSSFSGVKTPLFAGLGPVPKREPGDITNQLSPIATTGANPRRPLPTPPLQVAKKQPKSFGSLTSKGEEGVMTVDEEEIENRPIVQTADILGLSQETDTNPAVPSTNTGGSLTRKPSHRPRISRSHVVAKLHARRLASDSSKRRSSGNTHTRGLQRKSVSGAAGAGGVKASLGVSRHSGAGGATALAAKRRIRASEVARRKSRGGPSVLASAGMV